MAESQLTCHFGGGWVFERGVDEYHVSLSCGSLDF